MTFLGVPIFDWVLLVVLLGFGVEAWMTCRDKGEDPKPKSPEDDPMPSPSDGAAGASAENPGDSSESR